MKGVYIIERCEEEEAIQRVACISTVHLEGRNQLFCSRIGFYIYLVALALEVLHSSFAHITVPTV